MPPTSGQPGDSAHTLQDSSLIPSGADRAALQRNPTRATPLWSVPRVITLSCFPKGRTRQSSEQEGSCHELSMDYCCNTAHKPSRESWESGLQHCPKHWRATLPPRLGFFWTICFHIKSNQQSQGQHPKFRASCSYPYPSSSPPF